MPAVPRTVAGVSSSKVLAIGIGALLGAVAGNALVAGEGVTLVGGAAGGLLAAWWYDNPNSGPTRAAMHVSAEGPGLARETAGMERLASAR